MKRARALWPFHQSRPSSTVSGSINDDEDENNENIHVENVHARRPIHISVRAVVVGLLVGGLLCFSNMYFGLQTGWITSGSLQSSILGFGIFKLLGKKFESLRTFGPIENVILQTTAVATATMPIAGGFVGIIPAIMMMTEEEAQGSEVFRGSPWTNAWSLTLWALSISFFGVFFAVPLRRQTILKEKLKFPSGTATAEMIRVLHKQPPLIVGGEEQLSGGGWAQLPSTASSSVQDDEEEGIGIELKDVKEDVNKEGIEEENEDGEKEKESKGKEEGEDDYYSDVDIKQSDEIEIGSEGQEEEDTEEKEKKDSIEWRRQWNVLGWTFGVSSLYAIASYFLPIFHELPICSWVGLHGLTEWKWTLMPSLSYMGQGMIMGTRFAVLVNRSSKGFYFLNFKKIYTKER